MKVKFTTIISTIIYLSISCGDSKIITTSQTLNENDATIAEADTPENKTVKSFSKEDIARFTISAIMSQPSNKIKVEFLNGLYFVSYIRKSDSKKLEYKIQIDEKKVIWGDIDGRWRNGEYDEIIYFEESDNKLKIIQIFSDGSSNIKEFHKGE